LAICQLIERGENIFFCGPTCAGKTHLANALWHQALRKFLLGLFFSSTKLLEKIRHSKLNGVWPKTPNIVISNPPRRMRNLTALNFAGVDQIPRLRFAPLGKTSRGVFV